MPASALSSFCLAQRRVPEAQSPTRSALISRSLVLSDRGSSSLTSIGILDGFPTPWDVMASAIKPIEAKSVHQIQSGQVIVDLCSVVKELVENALDADATTIEVRFKNNGLDSIEVQDNGTGISEANYESIALKHYTSKLSTYEDLMKVQTFGFRGEALSSLCALSQFSIVTAQAHEAPRGKRLDFELSGKLKSTSLTAAQKGTTVTVENLFTNLPVRQKELSKNIKREYGKVLGLLHAYACISTEVKFTVKNAMPKARSSVVFSTKGNATTRDNIANVYGAKMLSQLTELNLKLEFPSTMTQVSSGGPEDTAVIVAGHISKPVFGEGRQTPDRQMFFVNGRPCGLPQIAKAINEVYKSYNVSQSPFIFADFQMDTNAYDVNVSPDKRTILLHDATALTDRLKTALTARFDDAEQTVPQSQAQAATLPAFRQLTMLRTPSKDDEAVQNASPATSSSRNPSTVVADNDSESGDLSEQESQDMETSKSLLKTHFGNIASTREDPDVNRKPPDPEKLRKTSEKQAEKIKKKMEEYELRRNGADEYDDVRELPHNDDSQVPGRESGTVSIPVRDFNARMSEQQGQHPSSSDISIEPRKTTNQHIREEEIGIVPNAFDKMRPRRLSPEVATITIGDRVVTRMIGTPRNGMASANSRPVSQFSQRLQKFDLHNDRVQVPEGQISESESERDSERRQSMEPSTPEFESRQPVVPREMDTLEETNGGKSAEEEERAEEERRVAELIQSAESGASSDSKERQRRAAQALKGSTLRDSTVNQLAIMDTKLDILAETATSLRKSSEVSEGAKERRIARQDSVKGNEEERLSLTISKADFAKMHIAGQFNLGFIIAVRHKDELDTARSMDELFIIDQHASDEKYNFERLQAETVVGNQRLVHGVILELTAVEEEIVLENEAALHQNGFIIDADHSGELPVGQRCKLLSLPLSKEVTFDMKDLEELIHLLSDSHISAGSTHVPRPSKVRKMFAMRACRSSIMIGKTLSRRQMRNVLDHMGRLDKPWNCPHGRPTMRHLTSLDKLDKQLWNEGDGVVSADTDGNSNGRSLGTSSAHIWKSYMA